MKAPLVSVLTTAYNREKYIAEAIESVLAQSLSDFELIIVDDGSTDRTVNVARQYLGDPRVRVEVNERNLGDYPNRNRAAELARGRYLKYLDADDIMYPHCLEIMINQMERYPEAGLGFQGYEQHNWPRPLPFRLSPAEVYREHFWGRGILNEGPTGAIIRADVFMEVGRFRPERYTGDVEFWIRVTRKKPLVMCYAGLVWWRRHAGQEFESGQTTQVIGRLHQILVSALTAEDCPLAEDERRAALRKIRRQYLRRVASAVGHARLNVALSLCRDLRIVAT